MDIILLGDPAAGKATQAARLVKKYKLIDFDMGKELRRLQRTGSSNVKDTLARTLSKGKLTPTQLYRSITKRTIDRAPKNKGILFDGHPKMIGEAKLVSKWLREVGRKNIIVLYLSIPEREILKRMRDRREYFKGKYSKRPDDNPKAMQRRIKYFRSGIKEVTKFFNSKYPFKKISGMGSRTEVHAEILKAVEQLNEFNKK